MLEFPKVKGKAIVINIRATEALQESIRIGPGICLGSVHDTSVEILDAKMILSGFEFFMTGVKRGIELDSSVFKYAIRIIQELQPTKLLFFHPLEVSLGDQILVNKEIPGFIHSKYNLVYTKEGSLNLDEFANEFIAPYFSIHRNEAGIREIKQVKSK